MKLKHLLFLLVITCGVIIGPRVHAYTYDGVATVGRGWIMGTGLDYYNTGWVNVSNNSYNANRISVNLNAFYIMGSEYVMSMQGYGDNYFEGYVTIPVSANTIYNYQLTNGLNQNDFKIGIDGNFGVYNVSPNITSFSNSCNVYAASSVAHTYCFYTVNFNFTTPSTISGATNVNFAIYNTESNRSSYYFSGGSGGSYFEFPNNYTGFNNTSYAMLRPYIYMTSSYNSGGSGGGGSSTDTTTIENNQQTIINQNNSIINNQQTINDSIEDINDTILDDSHESPNQFLQDMESLALSDTPITDLLAMPLNMVRVFHSGISGQCSTINLGSWYDKPLYIPCIDIPSIIGGPLWAIIDALFSGFMIYNIAELFIHDFDSLTSADDLFEETYTPRHGKPLGKHTKEVY